MNISLAGKVAVVTGAASGIGLATVKRFLECGAAGVVAVDRYPQPTHEPESRLVSIKADIARAAQKSLLELPSIDSAESTF